MGGEEKGKGERQRSEEQAIVEMLNTHTHNCWTEMGRGGWGKGREDPVALLTGPPVQRRTRMGKSEHSHHPMYRGMYQRARLYGFS